MLSEDQKDRFDDFREAKIIDASTADLLISSALGWTPVTNPEIVRLIVTSSAKMFISEIIEHARSIGKWYYVSCGQRRR